MSLLLMEKFMICVDFPKTKENSLYAHFFTSLNNRLSHYVPYAFFNNENLQFRYSTFNTFCTAIRLVKNNGNSLCFVTTDKLLFYISSKGKITQFDLSLFKELHINEIIITSTKIILGCNFTLILAIDFFMILDIFTGTILQCISFYTKLSSRLKSTIHAKFREFAAQEAVYTRITNFPVSFRAFIAKLWCRREIIQTKNSVKKYTLDLNTFIYTDNKPIKMHKISYEVNYSHPLDKTEEKTKSLIMKTDKTNSIVAIALNSKQKFYCQLLILSFHINYGFLYLTYS